MRNAYEVPKSWLGAWTVGVSIFVLAPLLFVVLVSLTPLDYISLPTTGVSARWYVQLAGHDEFVSAGINSTILALEAAATAMVLGVLAALAIVRYTFRLREVVRLVVTSPLFIPMVMSGLAILMSFSAYGWHDQASRIYVAHCALTLPYVIRTVSASMAGFDMNQELAARNLGASPVKAFLYVTLPQLGPGLLAGGLFAFIVSFDNVGLSIFLTGSQFNTLPVQLFSYSSYTNDPMAAAASVVMIAFSVGTVALLERFFGLQRLLRG